MANKQVVILDRFVTQDGPGWRVALWAAVPAAKQTFWNGFQTTSAWKGASAAENTAISTGTVREKVYTFVPPAAWTLAQMEAKVINDFNDWQTAVNADLAYGRYGTFYDGVSWTTGGA
jgi:hypothetical protein